MRRAAQNEHLASGLTRTAQTGSTELSDLGLEDESHYNKMKKFFAKLI